MIGGLRQLFVGASVSALLWARPAVAAPPSEDPSSSQTADEGLVLTRVVPDDNRVAARLGAELYVVGLETEWIDIDPAAPALGPDLLEHVEAVGASAAIEIIVADDRIDVWVADANTGKTLNRRFDLALDPGLAEPRTLAIAAVELLRASRLELEVRRAHDDESANPSGQAKGEQGEQARGEQAQEDERPPEPPEPEQRPPSGAMSLAGVFGGSPGDVGLVGQVEVAGRWAPARRRFGLRAGLWLPTLGNRVGGGDQGEVRLLTMVGFFEPQLRLPGGAPWFHPELGLGLGVALTIYQGQALDQNDDGQGLLPGFVAHAHLGLGFELNRRLWLRADGYFGLVQPQPRITVRDEAGVERVVARWGLPFGAGAIALEVWF